MRPTHRPDMTLPRHSSAPAPAFSPAVSDHDTNDDEVANALAKAFNGDSQEDDCPMTRGRAKEKQFRSKSKGKGVLPSSNQ